MYNRVDKFTPATNTWSREEGMPVHWHGIDPVVVGNSIYVATGGDSNGWGNTGDFIVFDTRN